MADPAPSVGVVIVAHNSASHLRSQLPRWSGAPQAEVVVVDNASTDDSVDAARAAGVTAIEMGANAGYAAACNRGAEVLRGRRDWIAFVNPDVDLDPDDLARIVTAAPKEAVALCPLLVDEHGRPLPDVARPDPTLASTLITWLLSARADRTARRMHARLAQAGDRWFDAPVTSGACLVVRSSALAHERFPEGYFLNCEDIEFCIRLRATGRILVDRDVPVRHARNSSSAGMDRTTLQFEAARAWLVFFARVRPKWELPVASSAIVAGMGVRGLRVPFAAPLSPTAWRSWATGTALLCREALRILTAVHRVAPLPPAPGPLFVGRLPA